MAVPTGSGTETIHSHLFKNVDSTQTLIYGGKLLIFRHINLIYGGTIFGNFNFWREKFIYGGNNLIYGGNNLIYGGIIFHQSY